MFTVLHVLPLAIGAAVSPALIGASLEILALFGARGRRMLVAYLLGAAAVVGTAVGLAMLLPERSSAGRGGAIVSDIVDLVLGSVLLVLAIVLLVRRPAPAGAAHGNTAIARLGSSRSAPLATLGLGVVMMLTNISTLALVLAGTHELRSSHASAVEATVGAVILVLGALLPILLPLTWELVSPRAATRSLARLNAALTRHARVIGVIVSGATAVYLILRGVGVL